MNLSLKSFFNKVVGLSKNSIKSILVFCICISSSVAGYSQDKGEWILGLSFNPATYSTYLGFSLDGIGWGGGVYSQLLITEKLGIELNPQWRVNPLEEDRFRCYPSFCRFNYREHNLIFPLSLTWKILDASKFCTAVSLHGGYSLEVIYTYTSFYAPNNYSTQSTLEKGLSGGRIINNLQAGIQLRYSLGAKYMVGWGGQVLLPISTSKIGLSEEFAPVAVFNLRLLRLL